MNNDYFFWEGNPVMVNLGEIPLPFPISIIGLIFGLVLFFVLPGFLFSGAKEKEDSHSKRKYRKHKQHLTSEDLQPQLTGWQTAGLLAGSLVFGQIIFLIIPSPTIEQIGPIMLRWYGMLFATAFISGYFIGRKLFKDAGKDVELTDKLLTYIVIATIVGARLGHVIFYDFEYYSRHLYEVLYIWQGGLASHGATIGIMLAIWLFIRKYPDITFFWLVDRLTIPVILGGAFVRLGNFFNSEIYGLPSEVPWAVIFARVDLLPRHPTMLYESLICILIFVLLIVLYRYYQNHPPEGLLTGVFMITLFTSRFLIEYTKVEQAPFSEPWLFGMGQLLSIPFVIFGIWVLISKVNRSQQPVERI
ncbi:MAG: prolipoprotein diacylglyceryl transferase [Balneolales bacterium]